ncbi:ribosome small subunit-dependent GTPase A [Phototrophicus methaneseepsis]|uniref:Small ribosomal subunit biogenesis GTPase RsgA n=1 Tax=Phototrophicus methaneseepsis TaxID=2710758 RepID=A0A7S8IEW2_9CHLR|nr:ribosome small subunit-dependent GTPase A [Phototrophicus methaneseepsis]QPC82258.1 ribosome small subunit-dependent GTPase A [Phototrophicus methaneseepsis]
MSNTTLNGLVVKEQSGFYWVEAEDESITICQLRGRLKEEAQASDIAAIGDRVIFSQIEVDGIEEERGVIEEVEERTSVLSRAVRTTGKRGVGQAEREHVLIANADQAFFVFAAAQPTPNLRMLDRMLVAGERSEIESLIIIINKIDLEDPSTVNALIAPYRDMGYEVLYTSAAQNVGIDALRQHLAGKISVFTGPSGVGKTSLLNRIQPGLGRTVKAISDYSQEGMHTTRDSALVKLENGGYLADTPGIRAIQVWDVEPDELDGYFRDLAEYVEQCKFSNCTHTNEPGCAVKAAVKAGKISKTRYENYLHLREDLKDTYIVY